MKKYKYGEGVWIAVPLGKGGYAAGLIVRGNPKTALVCYFFGPRCAKVPKLEDVEKLKSEQALCAWRIGDYDLRRGNWPILGNSENFRREDWPMPVFVHKGLDMGEKFPGRVEVRYYDEDDPAVQTRFEVVKGKAAKEALESFEQRGLLGSGAVEILLDDML